MTTLIMVQQADDVIIGWDSLATSGNEQASLVNPKAVVNNGIVFLVGGSTVAIDLIEELELPEYDGTSPRMWLIKHVAPKLREMVEENDFLTNSKGNINIGVLAVIAGQAFEFDGTFSPSQNTDGIYTVGSGGDYARGALYALRNPFHDTGLTNTDLTREDVLVALEAASAIDAFTGGALSVGAAKRYVETWETK